MHALANIVGETRAENDVLLDGDAEQILRRLIYEEASKSSKLTPSVSLILCDIWLHDFLRKPAISTPCPQKRGGELRDREGK